MLVSQAPTNVRGWGGGPLPSHLHASSPPFWTEAFIDHSLHFKSSKLCVIRYSEIIDKRSFSCSGSLYIFFCRSYLNYLMVTYIIRKRILISNVFHNLLTVSLKFYNPLLWDWICEYIFGTKYKNYLKKDKIELTNNIYKCLCDSYVLSRRQWKNCMFCVHLLETRGCGVWLMFLPGCRWSATRWSSQVLHVRWLQL